MQACEPDDVRTDHPLEDRDGAEVELTRLVEVAGELEEHPELVEDRRGFDRIRSERALGNRECLRAAPPRPARSGPAPTATCQSRRARRSRPRHARVRVARRARLQRPPRASPPPCRVAPGRRRGRRPPPSAAQARGCLAAASPAPRSAPALQPARRPRTWPGRGTPALVRRMPVSEARSKSRRRNALSRRRPRAGAVAELLEEASELDQELRRGLHRPEPRRRTRRPPGRPSSPGARADREHVRAPPASPAQGSQVLAAWPSPYDGAVTGAVQPLPAWSLAREAEAIALASDWPDRVTREWAWRVQETPARGCASSTAGSRPRIRTSARSSARWSSPRAGTATTGPGRRGG